MENERELISKKKHIIFGNISLWILPMLIVLKYLNLEIFYIYINATSDEKKNNIASKLKKMNILPLPLEFEKNILPKRDFSLKRHDPDEFTYKNNLKLVPDNILEKYCSFFSLKKQSKKKLRLLIQEFVATKPLHIAFILWQWALLYPSKKIIYISFNFKCFYIPDTEHKIRKIIIPLDILDYFIKILNIKKIFYLPFKFFKNNNFEKNSNEHNFNNIKNKSIAFVTHKGISYNPSGNVLYEKSLYYSEDVNSSFNKYNILHLDYSNFPSPEKQIHWVCLQKVKISNIKVLFSTLIVCLKSIYLIRNWSTFLGWFLCMQKYNTYIKYHESIKKFQNLKLAIIDYDFMCPKTLILALEKNNIKTIATQERFITVFYNSVGSVIVDTYYVASNYVANYIKDSKYHDVKNLVPVGQYRSDYISLYKNENIPKEILDAKKNNKKIIIGLGYHTSDNWFESNIDPLTNWTSHIDFLENMINLSKQLNNIFIVLRYKNLDWIKNEHFKDILEKLYNSSNILISENFTPFYAYRLCAHADLIIAKHTSIADECLSKGVPVLFYEYTHNMSKIISDTFDYSKSNLLCYNYDDLFSKSKSLLMEKSSKLIDEVKAVNNKFYKTEYNGKVKDIIFKNFKENLKSYY